MKAAAANGCNSLPWDQQMWSSPAVHQYPTDSRCAPTRIDGGDDVRQPADGESIGPAHFFVYDPAEEQHV